MKYPSSFHKRKDAAFVYQTSLQSYNFFWNRKGFRRKMCWNLVLMHYYSCSDVYVKFADLLCD